MVDEQDKPVPIRFGTKQSHEAIQNHPGNSFVWTGENLAESAADQVIPVLSFGFSSPVEANFNFKGRTGEL